MNMDAKQRFEVRLHPDVIKEYYKLDNSILPIVNKVIDELEFRADEVGKPLGNKHNSKLAGCKEIKLRDAGIRIIFRITNERVDILRIVYILAIERRSNDFVFQVASKRLKNFKNSSKAHQEDYLNKIDKWNEYRN